MAASSVPLHVSSLVEMLFGLEMLLRVMSLLTKLDILTAGRQERGTASGLKLLACSGNYGQHVQRNTCTLTNTGKRSEREKFHTNQLFWLYSWPEYIPGQGKLSLLNVSVPVVIKLAAKPFAERKAGRGGEWWSCSLFLMKSLKVNQNLREKDIRRCSLELRRLFSFFLSTHCEEIPGCEHLKTLINKSSQHPRTAKVKWKV